MVEIFHASLYHFCFNSVLRCLNCKIRTSRQGGLCLRHWPPLCFCFFFFFFFSFSSLHTYGAWTILILLYFKITTTIVILIAVQKAKGTMLQNFTLTLSKPTHRGTGLGVSLFPDGQGLRTWVAQPVDIFLLIFLWELPWEWPSQNYNFVHHFQNINKSVECRVWHVHILLWCTWVHSPKMGISAVFPMQ